MKNFKLLLAYDGTRYKGWQRLGGGEQTIQGKLEAVLSRLFEHPIEVVGSGRTDAGVHAKGQVANFWVDTALTEGDVLQYLRKYLPEDIGVLSVQQADLRFHSRLSAREKTYCYRVWNTDAPNVFERRYLTTITQPLDVEAMESAAAWFCGEHDFLAFCSNKHFKKSSVRTVYEFTVQQHQAEICFTVRANGFLYNMVRIMVGTLLEVGLHQRQAESIVPLFASRVREEAGFTAPAKGLCLMEVVY